MAKMSRIAVLLYFIFFMACSALATKKKIRDIKIGDVSNLKIVFDSKLHAQNYFWKKETSCDVVFCSVRSWVTYRLISYKWTIYAKYDAVDDSTKYFWNCKTSWKKRPWSLDLIHWEKISPRTSYEYYLMDKFDQVISTLFKRSSKQLQW